MNLKARYGQTYRIAREEGADRTGPKRPRPPIRRLPHVVGFRGHVVDSIRPRGSSEWSDRRERGQAFSAARSDQPHRDGPAFVRDDRGDFS